VSDDDDAPPPPPPVAVVVVVDSSDDDAPLLASYNRRRAAASSAAPHKEEKKEQTQPKKKQKKVEREETQQTKEQKKETQLLLLPAEEAPAFYERLLKPLPLLEADRARRAAARAAHLASTSVAALLRAPRGGVTEEVVLKAGRSLMRRHLRSRGAVETTFEFRLNGKLTRAQVYGCSASAMRWPTRLLAHISGRVDRRIAVAPANAHHSGRVD
jgi:hypothetical protein